MTTYLRSSSFFKKPERKIIAVSNRKGGIGKSTLSRELAFGLAHLNYSVLLVDMDPQGSLTKSLRDDEDELTGLYEAMTYQKFSYSCIRPELMLLAGSKKLAMLEQEELEESEMVYRLHTILHADSMRLYSHVIIDTPPSLSYLTIAALGVSHELLVPLHSSIYSMMGVNELMETVTQIRKRYNPDLNITGFVLNSYDGRPLINRQVRKELEETLKERLFKTVISKSIKFEEAVAKRKGLIERHKTHKSSLEILKLSAEVLSRIGA